MAKKDLNLPKERTFTGPALVWKRLLAFIVDLLIINIAVFLPFKRTIKNSIPEFGSYSEAYNALISNPGYTRTLTVLSLVMAIFALLYFALTEYRIQQTIGKMLFNISVVSEAKNPSFWQFIVRSLFVIPIFPFFLLWVIDPLFMFFTKSSQRLSEILSKTKTVESYVV